jgi:hypothetical protein
MICLASAREQAMVKMTGSFFPSASIGLAGRLPRFINNSAERRCQLISSVDIPVWIPDPICFWRFPEILIGLSGRIGIVLRLGSRRFQIT